MSDAHDDTPWGPEDDARVRGALMSLMDDVAAEPLPEPAFVRARSTAGGAPRDLRRRRRRSFTVIAGLAASALVATGATLLVREGVGSTPPAATSTATGDPALQMLDSDEWSAALGLPVASTQGSAEPDGQCFQTPQSDSWDRRVSTLDDGRVVSGQWIGTMTSGASTPPTEAIDQAVTLCEESHSVTQRVTEDLPGGATFRSWHARGEDGATYWWVEATRGSSTSYLTVAELDGKSYTSEEMRQVAQSALGDVDLLATSNAS